MTLRDSIRSLIARDGPLAIDRYMEICLHDQTAGYYATRPRLGDSGDFITAPLVSQMFGEMLGLWAVETWDRLGRPGRVRLVELGPGEGLMMTDALRAARSAPRFLNECEVWLVETSEPLRRRQAAALEAFAHPRWTSRFEDVPDDCPAIVFANEFLDCIPIRQAVRTTSGWRERRVSLADGDRLAFTAGEPVHPPACPSDAPVGSIFEWSEGVARFGAMIGARVARAGGAALFIDYGRDVPGFGDTLQALRRHRKESPLASPGEADLTAHVDFPVFVAAARQAGAAVAPLRSQATFLRELGIDVRATALARARPDRAATIARQLERLVAADQMGLLFKVAVVHQQGFAPPGFEATP